ncbi:diguanylate cyclase (GGDEF)-like protein [Clostridium acetobutylicum]|uniref:Sensory transduction protein with GGDEF and EAL domains n=1 Tax=Clostridium acetobutylicum (strain ATCC 824 / DSM 792 / JCM 1419 / IAM 19013 / LMG 5710 / NBRC 13948 / NRRL B-527 / VKM B-1787 / 2291 / W) TaxID=272562 RepID=Q97ET7_CLOAB|nr:MULTISPECIES: GGDEF and EAL domain-containing protein [Clostridium]AAK80960.1 Sensory transduction protein with GGDEF and EAL domains [Clostridium acetobutylicum ATCC 824]ADZ22062.1 Sensory transduction protein with GGDEF and EAL domains [Clostridium acetobutylicum EA 2018]AEI32651.1 sensory transduction protein [Clostridium acetobutylicum DSM 1731]AWV78629.1 EAL domain-containing protein [Clostridium acetobutylicum]MBC2393490.1 GGDEF and EAL domain-containing protein [Clostridium acetobuty
MWRDIINFTEKCKKDKLLLSDNKFALYLIDISKFRVYNYKYGYENGDRLLREISINLKNNLEDSCQATRIRGDKFVVLFPFKERREFKIMAQSIVEFFHSYAIKYHTSFRVDINMGVSLYPYNGDNVESVLSCAEVALSIAKNSEKSCYEVFDYKSCEKLFKDERILHDISHALQNKEFELYYQPQVDTNNKDIYGLEALLRWRHPQKGILGPNYFIAMVERNGMINSIGKFVIKEALAELRRFNDMGYEKLSMSINIAESQLCEESFVSFVKETVENEGVNSRNIIFEIIERTALSEKVLCVLNQLRELGIRIYIDDFGTMYSSLNYLYNIPLDGIKLDKSFVDKLYSSNRNLIVTRNIINLARDLDIDIIAEGVEYREQLKCLNSMNCSKIQGFIFSKPVDSNSVMDFFRNFKI